MTTTPDRPAFIIGGAQRSGTTYLAMALARHPDVLMAQPFIPEPKVLLGVPQSAAVYHARYRTLFARAKAHQVCGEKTSTYLESAVARARIRSLLPDVLLLFIVREPVARAYSNFLWSTKNGLETLPFADAIAQEGQRPDPFPPEREHVRPFDYLCRGDYARLAEPYLHEFGRERVRFVLYEDIARCPEVLLREIQSFLGLKVYPSALLDVGVVNSAKEMGPPLDAVTERQLKERFRPGVRAFAALSGLDLAPWGYDE